MKSQNRILGVDQHVMPLAQDKHCFLRINLCFAFFKKLVRRIARKLRFVAILDTFMLYGAESFLYIKESCSYFIILIFILIKQFCKKVLKPSLFSLKSTINLLPQKIGGSFLPFNDLFKNGHQHFGLASELHNFFYSFL